MITSASVQEIPYGARNAAAQPLPGRKTIEEYRKMFDDYRTTTETNTTQACIDYDYYDGKQLTTDERAKLQKRGQPPIVVNRTRVAINGILGIVARSHTDPKAWPRTPNDEDASSVATDILRYAAEKGRFNRKKTECFKDNLVGGICAMHVGGSDRSVPLSKVRWEEFFYDPRSREIDFSDARYMGIAKWMFQDDVQAKFKLDDLNLNTDMGGAIGGDLGFSSDATSDRPLNQGWLDIRNRRIMVVELYHRYGKVWNKCTFWAGGVLEEGVSPYKDEYGNTVCPIVAASCYIDRDNNRYGVVRDMRDLQDEINKRRSKLLHLVNSSQIQARDPSAIEVDANVARQEAARPDGVLPYGWEKVSTQDMAQGQSLLLSEAKAEMERFGPNPAVLGRQGSDTSGRAILARQQAGMIELAVVLDQMEDWELRVYQAIWQRVKQFWKAPQVIRVTDNPDDPSFIGINEPVPNPQAGQPVMVAHPVTGEQVQASREVPDPANDNVSRYVPAVHPDILGYKNTVAEMDVDIIIDSTPATATIMQEMFEDLTKLVASNPQYAQEVPFETFLELMPLPRKRQIIAGIQKNKAEKQAAAAKAQADAAALNAGKTQAQITELTSKSQLNEANALKARHEAHVGAIEAETGSLAALHDMTTPEGAPEDTAA